MPDRPFSALAVTFSQHVANLNRARDQFEREARDFNEYVAQHVEEASARPSDRDVQKLRWRECQDWSKTREVAWLNLYVATRVRLDIRQPGYTNFRKAAAYLYFEVLFDWDRSTFVFRARLENQNTVRGDLDETVFELARDDDAYPGSEHVKSNTAILFRHEVRADLLDGLSQSVDAAMQLVEAGVDQLYPDAEYGGEVADPEDDEAA